MGAGGSTELPLHDRIGHLVKRAEQAVAARKTQALRAVDLTVPQYTALLVLDAEPRLSGAQLARRCGVTPQTTAALLATLETKALITRTVSTEHSQVMLAALTRHGRAVLRRADRLAVSIEQHLAEAFSDGDRERLVKLLEHAISTLETHEVSSS